MRIRDWSSDVCSSDLPPAQTSKRRHHDGVAEHRSTGLRHYHMSALTMMLCNFDQYDGGSEQNHERQRGRDNDERAALGAECQIHQGKADIDRKSVGEGKSVSVRVDLGGRRIIKNKKKQKK